MFALLKLLNLVGSEALVKRSRFSRGGKDEDKKAYWKMMETYCSHLWTSQEICWALVELCGRNGQLGRGLPWASPATWLYYGTSKLYSGSEWPRNAC